MNVSPALFWTTVACLIALWVGIELLRDKRRNEHEDEGEWWTICPKCDQGRFDPRPLQVITCHNCGRTFEPDKIARVPKRANH